ncbi:hypothetical protein KAJ27_01645 [bacterium]|nr:hypothetical protein [bacterium]
MLSLSKIIALYSAGFLISLTPCVFPLIPVTIGVINMSFKPDEKKTPLKLFYYSAIYTLGILVMFVLLGLIGVAFGRVIEGYLQHYATKLIFGNMFILFGLVYFGMINFPNFDLNSRFKPDSIFKLFLFGAATSLALGPCSGPALTAVLADVAQTKSYLVGAYSLLIYGAGLSTIMLLSASFSGILAFVKKSRGNWMTYVKYAIGLLLIISGEYYIVEAGKQMAFL